MRISSCFIMLLVYTNFSWSIISPIGRIRYLLQPRRESHWGFSRSGKRLHIVSLPSNPSKLLEYPAETTEKEMIAISLCIYDATMACVHFLAIFFAAKHVISPSSVVACRSVSCGWNIVRYGKIRRSWGTMTTTTECTLLYKNFGRRRNAREYEKWRELEKSLH